MNFLGSRLKIEGVKIETIFDKFKGGFCLEYDEFLWSKIGSLFDSRARQTGIFTLCFLNIDFDYFDWMRY